MNKIEIRKKILDIRRKKDKKKLQVNFQDIFKILQKFKLFGKTVGGYYPYNYEVDTIKILKEFEKKKISNFITEDQKKFSNGFFSVVIKRTAFNQ